MSRLFIAMVFPALALSGAGYANTTSTSTMAETASQPLSNTLNLKETYAVKRGHCLRTQRYCYRGKRTCYNRRVCVPTAGATSYGRSCYLCRKFIYPTNRYRPMREIVYRRHTCDRYVMINLSGQGYRCLPERSGYRCYDKRECRFVCQQWINRCAQWRYY